jgi:hypothetical protein
MCGRIIIRIIIIIVKEFNNTAGWLSVVVLVFVMNESSRVTLNPQPSKHNFKYFKNLTVKGCKI